jgi:hypothetical protein
MPWTLEEKRRNVHLLTLDPQDGNEPFDQWALMLSDLHWDNPACNRELLRHHLDQALEHDAFIIVVGDFFCAMQGKYDRRSQKVDIRPEHAEGDYLDSLVTTAAEWFEPYKEKLLLLGYGNHETSIMDRHETDLLERLAARLRHTGGITRAGGYQGWIRLRCTAPKKRTCYYTIWYHHGFGGGGPVTQGKIDFNRFGTYVDTDMILCGHVHYKESFPTERVWLNHNEEITVRTMKCLRLGTYKDEFTGKHLGYHIEKGRGPRPLGGYWVRFRVRPRRGDIYAYTTESDRP